MNESGRQSVPTALPSDFTSAIAAAGSVGPGTNQFFAHEWMTVPNSQFSSVITSRYSPEFPLRMTEPIRAPPMTQLTNLNAASFGSVIDANPQDSFHKTISWHLPRPLNPNANAFIPMQRSETQELRTGDALLSNVPNNDAIDEGLSARLMAKSPSNGMVRSVPNSNPPSRDGTPANIGQYRPWELEAGGDYPHSQPSTPQSMSDMQNETVQRPPSASADKNSLKEMESRMYKSEYLIENPEYLVGKKTQMLDPLQPPRSVETPGRPPSCISSANSPAEVQEAHMMEENADQENGGQLFQRAQGFSDYFPDNRLGHINMQVSQALKLPNVYTQSNNNTNAQAPYVPVRQVMMGFPEGKLMKLDSDLTDLDMRGNSENTFQVPSVSSTTPRQSLAPVPQIHPAELNQWTESNGAAIHYVHNAPSDTDKSVKKKRKRCGECPGCLTKNNCGLCGPCKSVRSHQICKMRKCDELKTKKEKAAAAKASGQIYMDNDSSKSLNGQNSYQENDSLQLPSTPTSFQHDMLISGPLKNLNRSPGSNNSFVDINSYPGFPPPNTLMPFNGQSPPLEPIKLDPQVLSSDHQSLKDFSGAAIHEFTTARLKNLVNNRRNQKEQMQNYTNSQNLGSMYSEPSPSPVAASPQNDADVYAQRPPSTPTYMRSRAGSNPSDSGVQGEDASFLSHAGETTYENLKNLVPTPPDAEASWQKNGSSTDLENISKSIQNGQSPEEAIKDLIAETENSANGGLNYPVLSQDSLNNFHYQNFYNSANLQVNSTLDSYDGNHSTREAYSSTPTTSSSSGNYASQNAPPPYNSQYNVYPSQEMNMQEQPAEVSRTTSEQPQRPPSQDSSPPVKEKASGEQSSDPPVNGGTSSSSAPSPDRLVSKTPTLSSQQESSDSFLSSTTTSMNTYSNTISSYNPSPSNYTYLNSHISLPGIATFNPELAVMTNVMTDPLKGIPLTQVIDSGRNECLPGLDPSLYNGLCYAISKSMPNPIEAGKGFLVHPEGMWWEQVKNTDKLKVPPASPECEVLENQPSSPSTV